MLSGSPYPSAECLYCQNKRFVTPDVPFEDESWGRAVPCPFCTQKRPLTLGPGLSAEMRSWTFENTNPRPGQEEAFRLAQEVLRQPRFFLTLIGPYGSGKTRLLCCLFNAFFAQGKQVFYATTTAVLDGLRDAYSENAAWTFGQLFPLLARQEILLLDEFDTWNPTSWAEEKMGELFDWRHRTADSTLTIIASTQLHGVSPRILSRLQDGRCRTAYLRCGDQRRMNTWPKTN